MGNDVMRRQRSRMVWFTLQFATSRTPPIRVGRRRCVGAALVLRRCYAGVASALRVFMRPHIQAVTQANRLNVAAFSYSRVRGCPTALEAAAA